jgi:phenylpyruvate tautomerase PptA (4-oxalocrotonate tautomerase family)
MPHLSFAVNRRLPETAKPVFAAQVRALFAQVMVSGTDHIGLSLRECGTHDLSIGGALEPERGVAIVDADVRRGRSLEQRRALALGCMRLLQEHFGVPPEQVYVVFTEHPGEDFHLSDRYLADWRAGEPD